MEGVSFISLSLTVSLDSFKSTDIPFYVLFAASITATSGSIFVRLFPFSLDNQNNPVHLSPLQVRYKGKFM
jgi:hypothetical protein